jgi:hypothetical protein
MKNATDARADGTGKDRHLSARALFARESVTAANNFQTRAGTEYGPFCASNETAGELLWLN